jgi:hypothetical protein
MPFCVVSAGCTLYSCHMDDGCFIGANTVVLEGARLEEEAVVLPNSVVPPGRVVPSKQVWGGNPIRFVRFAMDREVTVTKYTIDTTIDFGRTYKYQFLPFANSHLYKRSDPEVRGRPLRTTNSEPTTVCSRRKRKRSVGSTPSTQPSDAPNRTHLTESNILFNHSVIYSLINAFFGSQFQKPSQ